MMVKSTWWISIIITVALLLVCGSTTTEAASYTYTYYVTLTTGLQQVWYCDTEIVKKEIGGSNDLYDPNTGLMAEKGSTSNWYYSAEVTTNAYILTYNGTEWTAAYPCYEVRNNMESVVSLIFAYAPSVETSETTLPSDWPEIDNTPIDEIVDNQINAVLEQDSDITSELLEIQLGLEVVYQEYILGNENREVTIRHLEDMIVFLFETYFDSNTGNIKSNIPLKDQTIINNIYNNYNTILTSLKKQDDEESYWNERDIEVDVSLEAQSSFNEEIEYLQSIEETVQSITTFDDGINENNKNQFIEVATDIWELDIFKYILPVAAICMVISVALGVRYRL